MAHGSRRLAHWISKWGNIILICLLGLSIALSFFSVSIHKEFAWDVETNLFYSSYLETQDMHIYTDYFNAHQKTPGAIWALTPIIYIFGGSFTSLFMGRLLIILAKTATALMIYFICLRLFKRKEIGLLAVFLFIITNIVNSVGGVAYTDPLHNFFAVSAIFIYLKKSKYSVLFACLLSSIAFIFHPKAVVLFFVFFINELIRWQNLKAFAKKIFQMAGGGLIGLLPLMLYLLYTGSIIAFIGMVVKFNIYNPLTAPSIQLRVFRTLTHLLFDSYLIVLFVIGFVFFIKSEKLKLLIKKRYATIFLWFFGFHLFFLFSRGYFGSYYYEVIAPLAIISAKTIFDLAKTVPNSALKKIGAGLLAIFLIGVMFFNFFNPVINLSSERDFYVSEFLSERKGEEILTMYSSDYFLTEKVRDFHFGKKQELSYNMAGLDKTFKSREDIQDLKAYIIKKNVSILHLYIRGLSDPFLGNSSDYISENFERVCLKQDFKANSFDIFYEKSKAFFGKARKNLEEYTSCRNFIYIRK